ncbi:hypothetical protein Tco_0607636 [Tanacetum coccineum]
MVRTEEDMKNLGFFGILKQSFKTVFSNKKIFTQITLTLILPLMIIFVAHPEISRRVFPKMELSDSSNHTTVADWVDYVLFEIVYYTLSALFFLLSTAAIIFTVACVYTDRDVTFCHFTKIVPKIWKRLLVTFIYFFVAWILSSVIYVVIIYILFAKFGLSAVVLVPVLLVLFILGLFYLNVVWQLASVVTVLENVKGFKAISKSNKLLNGKKKVEVAIAFAMYVVLSALIIAWELFVQHGDEIFRLHMVWRVVIGIVCGLVLMMWLLKFITIHTILYLVCKSVHGEAIDKLSLSTFLEEYTLETAVLPISGEEIGRTRASV